MGSSCSRCPLGRVVSREGCAAGTQDSQQGLQEATHRRLATVDGMKY